MSFSLPILGLIGRRKKLTNQRLSTQAIIRIMTRLLTSPLNTRCNGMFDLFMIRQIRINAVRHGYLVFLGRLSPAISETCSKIKHHWSKSEATRRNNEVGNWLKGEQPFWRSTK